MPDSDHEDEGPIEPQEGFGGNKSKKKKKKATGYHSYLHKIMKQVHPKLMISSTAMQCANAFIMDLENRISNESVELAKFEKKSTLSAKHVQTCVKTMFPGDMAGHAVSEATKALSKYNAPKEKAA